MLTPQDRYRSDATFRQLVDMLECLLHQAQVTPSEIRDACLLALIHHEEKAIRSWVMTYNPDAPDSLALERMPPPWAGKG